MNPIKIQKLISQGRLIQITKHDSNGNLMLIGYGRKSGSRKSSQQFLLKEPRILKEAQSK